MSSLRERELGNGAPSPTDPGAPSPTDPGPTHPTHKEKVHGTRVAGSHVFVHIVMLQIRILPVPGTSG